MRLAVGEAAADGRPDAGRVARDRRASMSSETWRNAPPAAWASASRMHGSMPIRSISLMVKTFASSCCRSSRSPASSERTPTSASLPGSTAGSSQPSCRKASPASPSAAASTIPCTLPEGDVSGVLRSPCASIQTTPPAPRACAIPSSEPRATEWSPPRTSGSAPARAATATRRATSSQTSRISARKRACSSPLGVCSASGVFTLPKSLTRTPTFSGEVPVEPGVADRGGAHVDAAAARAEIERRADHGDLADVLLDAHERRG